MLNRTLHYFKTIKFNQLVNNTLANEGKKKINLNNVKKSDKNFQRITIRKFGIGHFNYSSEPPFNNYWIIIAAFICGGSFTL